MNISKVISAKRKELGITQQILADKLHVSFQAISKWENGTSYPDIETLPLLASVLNVSIDSLLGYPTKSVTEYDNHYAGEEYYWGLEPNKLCYEIMQRKPPVKPYKILDIGCGEGKDAVFLAKNGYDVTAFDVSDIGIQKAKALAEIHGVTVDFFKADIKDFRIDAEYDIIFSSGVFHYIPLNLRQSVIDNLKAHTRAGGLNVINVFVSKPFIFPAPDMENEEFQVDIWKSGELFAYYHDWLFYKNEEIIFDCNSSGVPHKHCINILIAEKITH